MWGVSRGNDCVAGVASGGRWYLQRCRLLPIYQETTVYAGPLAHSATQWVTGSATGRGCAGAVSYTECTPIRGWALGRCRTLCGQDADCASGVLPSGRREFRCHDESGECADQAFLGSHIGDQCMSGHCVDGVCCDTGCDSLCESCQNETGIQSGTCSPLLLGPTRGKCRQPRSSCGTVSYCDGAGACSLYSKSTVCLGAYCDGDDRLNAVGVMVRTCSCKSSVVRTLHMRRERLPFKL